MRHAFIDARRALLRYAALAAEAVRHFSPLDDEMVEPSDAADASTEQTAVAALLVRNTAVETYCLFFYCIIFGPLSYSLFFCSGTGTSTGFCSIP